VGGEGGGRMGGGPADAPDLTGAVLQLVLDRVGPRELAVARAVCREWCTEASEGARWARHYRAAFGGPAQRTGTVAGIAGSDAMQRFAARAQDPWSAHAAACRGWDRLTGQGGEIDHYRLRIEVLIDYAVAGVNHASDESSRYVGEDDRLLAPLPEGFPKVLTFWFEPKVCQRWKQSVWAQFNITDLRHRLLAELEILCDFDTVARVARRQKCLVGYFRTSQQTCEGDEATNTGAHSASSEDETDVEDILSNSRTTASLWGFGRNARVCLLESKLTAPQTIEANMSISHRTGFYVWTNDTSDSMMESDPFGADPNYYDLSVAVYAHFWEERPFGALRGEFPTGTAPLPPLHLVKGPGMAAAYRKSDLFLTADLNVLEGECIGSLQCVLEWKEDREEDRGEICSPDEALFVVKGDVRTTGTPLAMIAGVSPDRDPMVDFSLYDPTGRLLLGRAGVELWSREPSWFGNTEPEDKVFMAEFFLYAEDSGCACDKYDHLLFIFRPGEARIEVRAGLHPPYPSARRPPGPWAAAFPGREP